MRRVILCCLGWCWFVLLSTFAADGPSALRADLAATRLEYCETGGFIVARVSVDIALSNSGPVPLIISKFADIDYVSLRGGVDSGNRNGIVQQRRGYPREMVGQKHWSDGQEPSREWFDVVAVGGLETMPRSGVMLILNDLVKSRVIIPQGEYSLSVRLSLWRESRDLARRLSDIWRGVGSLETEPIVPRLGNLWVIDWLNRWSE